jgi:hypothetical protein
MTVAAYPDVSQAGAPDAKELARIQDVELVDGKLFRCRMR